MVILGPATNEAGANCWVTAYDVKTGKELWRFYTAPTSADEPEAKTWAGDSWKHGGSPIWNGGAYDPETNLTFWGTGNPNPGWNGDPRAPGDNLYSDSVVALDADTGKLKWYYQFTPGDEYDWDATQVPVLANMDWKGQPRKVMLWANRNGFFYVLDRTTGQFLLGKTFVKQNWASASTRTAGPIKAPRFWPKPMGGTYVEPGTQGGTNWYPPSYSPQTGLFYLSVWDNYVGLSGKGDPGSLGGRPALHRQRTPPYRCSTAGAAAPGVGRAAAAAAGGRGRGRLPITGRKRKATAPSAPSTPRPARRSGTSKWSANTETGVLSTAGDLVFGGGMDGDFRGARRPHRRAAVARRIWAAPTPAVPSVTRSTGKQYIVGTGEGTMYRFRLPD